MCFEDQRLQKVGAKCAMQPFWGGILAFASMCTWVFQHMFFVATFFNFNFYVALVAIKKSMV